MIVHSIPPASVSLMPVCEFTAVLNVLTGLYEVTEDPVVLLDLDPRSIYLFETLTVSSNIDNQDFFESNVEPLEITFNYLKTDGRAEHFPQEFQIQNIGRQNTINTIFYSSMGSDKLRIIPSGVFNQNVNMIDVEELVFRVSATVYRTGNQPFVNRVKAEWGQ